MTGRPEAEGIRPRRRALAPLNVALVLGLIGALITASASWAAWTINEHNEHRLLEVQTRQAAGLISVAILTLRGPLETVLEVEEATGGSPTQFATSMSRIIGTGKPYVSGSLWRASGGTAVPVASVGVPPLLDPTSARATAFIILARNSKTFVVTDVGSGSIQRIAYALSDPSNGDYVLYAERAIPANRQVPIESDSAFADLHFVTYLGPKIDQSAVATTDVPVSELPLKGDTVRETIPFGNTVITMVASARRPLGGPLGQKLPWIFLAGGALLTVAGAVIAEQLSRRRRSAERDAQTIAELYQTLDGLYGEQRTIAEALQQALLPAYNPHIPGLEIATRYVAGARGVEIGGDWYSVVQVDDDHFAFVVGDVSGRGVSAATIMARLRFTIRAYLLEGHSPDVVLSMTSRQLDVTADGHFATVVVGIGNLHTRELLVSNAGHLNPLVIRAEGGEYVTTALGPPLGIAATTYEPTPITVPPDAALLAFTDGLVERRGESIDVGLDRLATLRLGTQTDGWTLETLLTGLLDDMSDEGSEDDIALLAFRWTAT